MTPPQAQYRYPRRHTPRPEPGTLDELTDEQLELYEIPAQTRSVLTGARCLDDAVGWEVDIAPYVTHLVDETRRLRSLEAEHLRRIDARIARIAGEGG